MDESQYGKFISFVTEFVQKKIVETYHLQEVWIPEDRFVDQKYHSKPKCNVFMSLEFKLPKPDQNAGRRALVLIQGSGNARAGIWANSVCMNDSLEMGSMLPLLDTCRNLNIPLLVMNPNLNSDPETGISIPFSMTMAEHACYVWEQYVLPSGFD